MSQEHVTVAEEEYLQVIFWLHEAGLPMTGANVARAMQLSAPTVHEMIGRLERDGYVTRGPDKVLAFTESGLEHAMSPTLEERMLAAIGDAKTCPHGHPLSPGSRVEGVPLADVEEGAKVTVLRFENEAESLLHLFKDEGLALGKEGKVAEVDAEHVVVAFEDGNATLTRSVSETVSVLADPSPPPRTALPEQLVLAKERYGR